MKKTLELFRDDNEYVLKDKNPGNKNRPFNILISDLKFETEKFYEYVFEDYKDGTEIVVTNSIEQPNSTDRMVFNTITEICKGIVEKMKSDE